jgi:hemerythrin-like domain-containing protein
METNAAIHVNLVHPEHHREIDAQLARLIHVSRRGDYEELRAGFKTLEGFLLEHMDDEERTVLPEMARELPNEAAAIRAEHDEIRTLLGNLGVGIDLRLFRVDTAEALAERLRDHANREDALMYTWAARHLPRG